MDFRGNALKRASKILLATSPAVVYLTARPFDLWHGLSNVFGKSINTRRLPAG